MGYIEDPADFYAKADVAINPVFQGTGLKIKTFEAISFDKVTLVHPHSMAGVFRKDDAPLFASDKPEDWVVFLKKIWGHHDAINAIKQKDKEYLQSLNEFIVSEYDRLINA